jgi:hypothetical protein
MIPPLFGQQEVGTFWFTLPLFVKKGLTVGQKSLDLGPPAHLSIKYVFIDLLLSLVI